MYGIKTLASMSLQERTLMLVLFIVTAILIVVITITFVISSYLQGKLLSRFKDKSNTVRIYMVDVKNDKVDYFNSSKLRNKNSTSITNFYTHFNSKDRQKLISWIGDLVENAEGVKNFMEISAFVKRYNKNVPSILQVQKIDYKKKIVYLESYLLANEGHKRSREHTFVSRDKFLRSIKQREGIGYSFCFNFFNKFNLIDDISDLAFVELKNIISSYASDKVNVCISGNSRFYVSNFECDNKIEALNFINQVKEKLNSYLLIESFSDEIDFSIGAAENIFFKREIRSLIRTLANLSEYAKDSKQEIIFFDESKKNIGEESSFKTEVENIIENGKLQYFYQPIFSFKYGRVVSYKATIRPVDTVFANIEELKQFAVRTDDDQELFATIVKNLIGQFVQEKGPQNVRLFLPISISELAYVNSTLSHVPDVEEANVVLEIDEKEIENALDNPDYNIDDLTNVIRTVKSNGYSVSLIIENDVLNLNPSIYSLFDFFILRLKDFGVSKRANKIPTFRALVENLIRYNKSIIALDIPSWDAVDLVYKFGIENVSGDAIAVQKENVVPLDRKMILKIKRLKA